MATDSEDRVPTGLDTQELGELEAEEELFPVQTRSNCPFSSLPLEIYGLMFLHVPCIGDLCVLRDTSAALRTLITPDSFKSVHVQGTVRDGLALGKILQTSVLAPAVQTISFDYDEGSRLQGKGGYPNNRLIKDNIDHVTFTNIFCSAFSRLERATNLHSLILQLHRKINIDLKFYVSPQVYFTEAVLKTISDRAPRSLISLFISSLPASSLDCYRYRGLSTLLRQLRTLSFSTITDHHSHRRREDAEHFWCCSLMRLFPAPVHSNLQSLCLRSPGLTVGYAPVIGLDILTFPHLTGLELVNLAFGRDTSTERFIFRHKATLRRLEVIDCLMVCNELEVVGRTEDNRWEVPRTWEDTFDGFRKELGCLQEIEVWEYGYGRYKKYLLLDVKVYREQEDADVAALQELESVVKRRRDAEL